LASLFCCGLVSLAAQALGWAGDVTDRLMMATPLGPRLLGVPEPAIARCSLAELVGEMQRYNSEQAAARMGGGTDAPVAPRKQQQQQGQQTTGEVRECERGTRRDGAYGKQALPKAGGDDAVLAYSRALAASAIWLALNGKKAAEFSGLAGAPLARALGRSLTQWPGPGLSLPVVQVEEVR
jgi:hypothetical protein